MSPCPNCTAAAFGTEAASICTNCATATVAGASFSVPMALAGACVVIAGVLAYRMIRVRLGRSKPIALEAVA